MDSITRTPRSPTTKPAVVATWSLSNTSSGRTANTPGPSSFEVRFTSAASHGGVVACSLLCAMEVSPLLLAIVSLRFPQPTRHDAAWQFIHLPGFEYASESTRPVLSCFAIARPNTERG